MNLIINYSETVSIILKVMLSGIVPIKKFQKSAFLQFSSSFQKLVSTLQLKKTGQNFYEKSMKERERSNGDLEGKDDDVICISYLLLCSKALKTQGIKTIMVLLFLTSLCLTGVPSTPGRVTQLPVFIYILGWALTSKKISLMLGPFNGILSHRVSPRDHFLWQGSMDLFIAWQLNKSGCYQSSQ